MIRLGDVLAWSMVSRGTDSVTPAMSVAMGVRRFVERFGAHPNTIWIRGPLEGIVEGDMIEGVPITYRSQVPVHVAWIAIVDPSLDQPEPSAGDERQAPSVESAELVGEIRLR